MKIRQPKQPLGIKELVSASTLKQTSAQPAQDAWDAKAVGTATPVPSTLHTSLALGAVTNLLNPSPVDVSSVLQQLATLVTESPEARLDLETNRSEVRAVATELAHQFWYEEALKHPSQQHDKPLAEFNFDAPASPWRLPLQVSWPDVDIHDPSSWGALPTGVRTVGVDEAQRALDEVLSISGTSNQSNLISAGNELAAVYRAYSEGRTPDFSQFAVAEQILAATQRRMSASDDRFWPDGQHESFRALSTESQMRTCLIALATVYATVKNTGLISSAEPSASTV